MPIIAVANLKGGVGKSTIAVNLCGVLSPRAVLVDADPQATATAWAEGGDLPFDVLPRPLEASNAETWLSEVLSLSAEFTVVDLPPMLGGATAAALAVADLAVIPVTPSGADIRATNAAMQLIRDARAKRKGVKPRALLIPSKVDRRTAAGAEIEAVLHDYDEAVGPIVSQRIAHADAFTAGQWIGQYAPASPAHTEIKALGSVARKLAAKD